MAITRSKQKILLALLITLPFLTSCFYAAGGAAVATGVLIQQDKSVADAANDGKISSMIFYELAKDNFNKALSNINVEVYEGRVLLTGYAAKEDDGAKAIAAVWRVKGVKEVIDEIEIVENIVRPRSPTTVAADSLITSRIKSKLLFAKDLDSLNYNVTTFNKKVYLLGMAQDEMELRRTVDIASQVRGVKEVVSHVVLKDDPRRTNKIKRNDDF